MKRHMSLMAALLLCAFCSAAVPVVKPRVLETFPHDKGAYTQGLFFHGGVLYESTGQNGRSSIRTVDLKSGKVLSKHSLERKYFGEGAAIVGNRLYMLTWTSGVALIFDKTDFKLLKTVPYPREGWGLAALPQASNRGKSPIPANAVMVASDGSSKLYFMDSDLKCLMTLKVMYKGKELKYLNELEWIDGRIWANVYTSDYIAVINPSSGDVETMVDCSDLIPQSKRTADMDVLNGIAMGPDGSIYLTGKNWPKMFRITL